MTTRYSPQIETGFSLRLLNRVCDGAGSLRDALLNEGLRPELIAFAGGVSLRTLRNATDNGRTRRGMLVRLAALAVIIEDLHSEDVPLQETISPYAATKLAGEQLCSNYAHLYGLRTVCLRFFTVYGPRQRPDLAIHQFTERISAGRAIRQFGDGTTRRHDWPSWRNCQPLATASASASCFS